MNFGNPSDFNENQMTKMDEGPIHHQDINDITQLHYWAFNCPKTI
jgi:hypothetical protein